MSSKDRLLQELKLLLDSASEWHLAAFYADPEVDRMVKELYSRWECVGRVGEPVDYATEQELRKLINIAKRYLKLSLHEAFRRALGSRT